MEKTNTLTRRCLLVQQQIKAFQVSNIFIWLAIMHH